jgi:hypothetical protein
VKILEIKGGSVFVELPRGLRYWTKIDALIREGVKPEQIRVGQTIRLPR